ncbi:DnaJ domain-containing protein [Cryptosporidium serpentis]
MKVVNYYGPLLALPPIPLESSCDISNFAGVVYSGIAEFVNLRSIEAAGEAFFDKYERCTNRKVKNTERRILNPKETTRTEYLYSKSNESKYGTSRNKSNNVATTSIVTLSRLKELVKEPKTLYDKLGILEVSDTKEIKKAYRKLVLAYHPDKQKNKASLDTTKISDDNISSESCLKSSSDPFLAIQEAYEILSNPILKQSYDSALPFDESIPTSYTGEKGNFEIFKSTFEPVFKRNSHWSLNKPVPSLGNLDETLEKVESFYRFWRSFQTCRDFSIHYEYDISQSECREEKRWMERQNSKIRTKYLNQEVSRINKLVEMAYKHDPRIIAYKEDQKVKKEQEKMRREKEKFQKLEEEQKIREEIQKKEEDIKRKTEQLKYKIKSLRLSIRTQIRKACMLEELFEFNTDFFSFIDGINIFLQMNGNCSCLFLENLNKKIKNFKQSISNSSNSDNDFIFKTISYKQWDDWLLKNNETELEVLDNFIDIWLNNYYSETKTYELAVIFCMVIGIPQINLTKSDKIEKVVTESTGKKNVQSFKWTVSELSLLAKALQKYPGGVNRRWELVTEFVGNTKTKEEILIKVKELSEAEKLAKLSLEVAEESAFDIFLNVNKGVFKKCDNIPDIRDLADMSNNSNINEKPKSKNEDIWTEGQQTCFEVALRKYPTSLPAKERWEKIASEVPDKTSSQCIARFKFIREQVKAKLNTRKT